MKTKKSREVRSKKREVEKKWVSHSISRFSDGVTFAIFRQLRIPIGAGCKKRPAMQFVVNIFIQIEG
jgi:hypothetical protein